ncbi:hypothetical protein EJ04DRAFT_122536 [Polyplosphaeria fusca]|uniref:Uncharacterized protein n=1 Tax=Polyplosphaeria fusca TaxID=682080 RepID=A0A9P4QNF0_9PLEO|nr:hypothetical protein EJ04DRAFT_122536 [Polyplosphaeria fusca]
MYRWGVLNLRQIPHCSANLWALLGGLIERQAMLLAWHVAILQVFARCLPSSSGSNESNASFILPSLSVRIDFERSLFEDRLRP